MSEPTQQDYAKADEFCLTMADARWQEQRDRLAQMLAEAGQAAVKAATEELRAGLAEALSAGLDDAAEDWRRERQAREKAEKERDDHVTLANEVALGATHSTVCDQATPCVRCQCDAALAEVERLKAELEDQRSETIPHCSGCGVVLNCCGDASRAHDYKLKEENAALRKRVEEAESKACACKDCREHRWRCGEVERLSKRVESCEQDLKAAHLDAMRDIEQARREGIESGLEMAAKHVVKRGFNGWLVLSDEIRALMSRMDDNEDAEGNCCGRPEADHEPEAK